MNHHRGYGANHIYGYGNEYYDISPVLDYQKIPGTTVVQKNQLPHHREIKKLGLTDFVGATTDGRYGVVGFDYKVYMIHWWPENHGFSLMTNMCVWVPVFLQNPKMRSVPPSINAI